MRISSLRFVGESASLKLLKALINSPSTPGRLKGLAADMYAEKSIKLYLARQERKQANPPTKGVTLNEF
jgi:hypothetical protein